MEKASKRNNYYYNSDLQQYAKENKKNFTRSARVMWSILKGGNMLGFKFRRERPILNYIVDFCCLDLLLIIEVDGLSHDSEKNILKDEIRDQALHEIGFTVLRFDAIYVLNNPDDVIKDIQFWIEDNFENSPTN